MKEQLKKAFTLAKVELEWDHMKYSSAFICHALEEAVFKGLIAREYAEMARKLVMDRLDDCYSYDVWLQRKHPELTWCYPSKLWYKKAYEGRQAWLDSLIKEFS
jgi:hypothetical protein